MSSPAVVPGRVHSVSTVAGSGSVVTIEIDWPERLSDEPFPQCGSSVTVDLRGHMLQLLREARDELRDMGWRTNRELLAAIESALSDAAHSGANDDPPSGRLGAESS